MTLADFTVVRSFGLNNRLQGNALIEGLADD
jgi:hypothetical protein